MSILNPWYHKQNSGVYVQLIPLPSFGIQHLIILKSAQCYFISFFIYVSWLSQACVIYGKISNIYWMG